MARLILLVLVAGVTSGAIAEAPRETEQLSLCSDCQIYSKVPAPQRPLIVSEGEDGTLFPGSELPSKGTKYTLLCPGQGNRLKYLDGPKVTVSCTENGELETEHGIAKLNDLICAGTAGDAETVTRNGTCYNGYTKIDISFPTYTWIEICHNEVNSETVWTKNIIDGPNLDNAESPPRPGFVEAGFYPELEVNTLYTQIKQTETIGLILGSAALAADYIIPSQDLYFARGHLTPNADGIPAEERLATFYFINVIPQWQVINDGNWVNLENALRDYARAKQTVLTVYTGAWGVTTLKDINGNPQEIWLGRDGADNRVKALPAPRAYYKVVLDQSAGTGVAIVTINNPYEDNFNPADIICESICDSIPWVTWNVTDHYRGYTYCCTVSSFYSAHSVIPNPGNPALMI